MFTNQNSMNPTGDKLTAELQNTTHIEQPVVVGQGEKTTMTEKFTSGVEYTGDKLKATGEVIGEKFGETLHGVEQTVHKAAEIVAEETAKVELPGVVTLFTSGAAKLFGHFTGATETTSLPTQRTVTTPLSPATMKSDIMETIVSAEKNLAGDIITTDVKPGHFTVASAPSRVDVLKESGQLGHQTELHLPNLHICDVPLNRAVEEQPIHEETEQKTTKVPTQPARPWASFVTIHPELEAITPPAPTWASFVTVHSEPKADNFERHASGLTTSTIHDGVVFLDKVEQLDNLQSHKSNETQDGGESEQTQQPNFTLKMVHDGAAFIGQAEQQKNIPSQQAKGTINQSMDLPSLTTKDVQDGAQFIDVVENQSI